ncbi:MAG: hypothetical protein EAZ81_01225 [Verrucomicrobia bacterium]|jgi:hypothetical protein|nr:MAG: hypothetical protein EAZ81_01225 [Verrucomicrobiota bacterium]
MKRPSSANASSILLAKSILSDRSVRRKWLGSFALILVLGFAAGTSVLSAWLSHSIWRFFLYWMALLGWALLVIVFALYDALCAVREERERMK